MDTQIVRDDCLGYFMEEYSISQNQPIG